MIAKVDSPLDLLSQAAKAEPKGRREARAGRASAPRPWAVQRWRSRTSSATTEPPGVRANAGHLSLGQLKVMSGHRALPHGSAAVGTLRCCAGLCSHPRSPTTPAATGTAPSAKGAAARKTGWPRARPSSWPVPYLPCRVHAARSPISRHRLSEQARDLRPAVQGQCTRPCSPSQPIPSISAPGSPSPAVLHTWGSAHDTSSAPAHGSCRVEGYRPDGQRWVSGRPRFFLPVRVSSHGCSEALLPGQARGQRTSAGRTLQFFGDHATAGSTATSLHRAISSRHGARPSGWSTPSSPSADPRPYSPISAATPTVSPSQTTASSPSTTPAVTFKWKDYRAKGRDRQKTHDPGGQTSSSGASSSTSCPEVSTGSDITACFANGARAENLARARELLDHPATARPKMAEPADAMTMIRKTSRPRTQPCPSLRRTNDRHRKLRAGTPHQRTSTPTSATAWPQ